MNINSKEEECGRQPLPPDSVIRKGAGTQRGGSSDAHAMPTSDWYQCLLPRPHGACYAKAHNN